MADNKKKIIPINYTNREFDSIRDDLMEIAERLYPDSFKDFSEASFGALMIDTVAYIGDQLSFYLDYQANESFLNTSIEYTNIVRHAIQMGYKFEGRPSTYGKVALYIVVPATTAGLGADTAYLPILKTGTLFGSNNGTGFLLNENIYFNNKRNKAVVAKTDPTTGAPTHYAVKTYGNVVSGRYNQERIEVGAYEKYKSVRLANGNVSEIISVFDDSGNEYFEVPYLTQDVIYQEVSNPNFKNDDVASVLKPRAVPRRFVTVFDRSGVALQFGTGDETLINENKIPEPQKVAIDIYGKDYISNTFFDPSNLVVSDRMGIVPSNTTLTVVYRSTNPLNSNVAVGGVSTVEELHLDFENRISLDSSKIQDAIDSIEVSNEEPIVGDVTVPTSTELKRRIQNNFATQNRAVTKTDYEALVYRMPPKFGSIKRCLVARDPDSRKRNINMYVLSEDTNGLLTTSNGTIKNNLKTWISQYKMMNDTVDILDAKIVNIGIQYSLRIDARSDKYAIQAIALSVLRDEYAESMYIGEPFYISDIYTKLNRINGVVDVVDVELIQKYGSAYSPHTFNIEDNMSPDGRYLIVPKNVVLEVKYPDQDIRGAIK